MKNLFRRTKQADLVGNAERDAAAFAVGVEASDSGDVPKQSACADADAKAGRAIRFGSERSVFARAVAPVDLADQSKSVVDLISRRQAENRHIVLRERADIPGGVNRPRENPQPQIADKAGFAQ